MAINWYNNIYIYIHLIFNYLIYLFILATPRSKGGIRDGIPRDIITTLWREKITRNCFYNRSI